MGCNNKNIIPVMIPYEKSAMTALVSVRLKRQINGINLSFKNKIKT